MILLLVSILVPACLFYAVVFVNFRREVVKGRQRNFHTSNVVSFNPTTRHGDPQEVYQIESAYFGPFLIVPLGKPPATSDRIEHHTRLARARP